MIAIARTISSVFVLGSKAGNLMQLALPWAVGLLVALLLLTGGADPSQAGF
jgi:hypothetical protein